MNFISKKNNVSINPETMFLLSTSGSNSSIEKHNKALQSLGVNLIYFTFGREITAESYINLLKSPIVRGGAVTGQGLKTSAISMLDEVDELAKNIGAVNTVVNEKGKLSGYNTDAFGFESALKKHLDSLNDVRINNAVIYGYGGVSGVAVYILKKMGVEVTMKGRNKERLENKMKQLHLKNINAPYDLVVNATPISSEPLEQTLGFLDILDGCKIVFDHNMPEKDKKKNYLKEYCEENGIHFIPGNDMYIPQMIQQWKLFLNNFGNNEKSLKITDDDIIRLWNLI